MKGDEGGENDAVLLLQGLDETLLLVLWADNVA
jgi:hypothetical protein